MDAIHTRRLYSLEKLFPREKDVPMSELREFGLTIWFTEGGGIAPKIVAGRGAKYNGRLLSYCEQEPFQAPTIVLSRNQRKVTVLIHEITHGLGYWTHDEKFVKRYFEILDRWTPLKRDYLLLLAQSQNIDIRKL